MRRLIYLINWRASKLQMGPRQTAHWYPFDHAQGSNTGTAKWHAEASGTPCLASACGNPKGYHRNSHTLCPHAVQVALATDSWGEVQARSASNGFPGDDQARDQAANSCRYVGKRRGEENLPLVECARVQEGKYGV